LTVGEDDGDATGPEVEGGRPVEVAGVEVDVLVELLGTNVVVDVSDTVVDT
jgi:hypothetical protein